MSKQCAKVVSQ